MPFIDEKIVTVADMAGEINELTHTRVVVVGVGSAPLGRWLLLWWGRITI
jgi:hypothetical protein